jgi:hypothetical protein
MHRARRGLRRFSDKVIAAATPLNAVLTRTRASFRQIAEGSPWLSFHFVVAGSHAGAAETDCYQPLRWEPSGW